MKEVVLFCFPYAGGTAQIYQGWKRYLSSSIELIPIELAGRGRRFLEPHYESFHAMVEDVQKVVSTYLDGRPYFFFGHSMGSLIAYEVAIRLRELEKDLPTHMFLSGRAAPHHSSSFTYHLLSDEELKKEIFSFGGTPEEYLQDPDFLSIFLPMIRSDLKAVDTYSPSLPVPPLLCRFTILNGKQDELVQGKIEGWCSYTQSQIEYIDFEGGHFYLHDYRKEIADLISSKVKR